MDANAKFDSNEKEEEQIWHDNARAAANNG